MKQKSLESTLSARAFSQAHDLAVGRKRRLVVRMGISVVSLFGALTILSCSREAKSRSTESELTSKVKPRSTSRPKSNSTLPKGDPSSVVTVVRRLDGDASGLALDAVYDNLSTEKVPSDFLTLQGPFGHEVSPYYLTVGLAKGATIGEVNTMLETIDGSISAMLEGTDVLILRIPGAADYETLRGIVDRVKASPGINMVRMEAVASHESAPRK